MALAPKSRTVHEDAATTGWAFGPHATVALHGFARTLDQPQRALENRHAITEATGNSWSAAA
ncbi:hypothetical protein BJ965_000096 [Streptomyces luteogriseus]|uniref:Uncharacterized protein n=1 Tax=Streptomyces luteogriseus TaxID=68233 RepID=A0A7W7DG55_9ACTN|nr:hypothetical protein [Streptomyces luteogriseus]